MSTKLKLGLEWFLNPDHVPFLIGLDKGWFEAAGIDLELVAPEAHMDAFEAMQAGALDVAITEPIHLVEDVAKGRDVLGFARFLHTNGGVMYLADSGITRPRDMAGRRVQYPGAPGPGGKAIVSTMIEADGGEPGALEPVNHGFMHTEALVEGKADVATLAFYNFEVVEARHKGHDAHFFALKDWGVPDFCQLILVAPADTLRARGEELTKLVQVISKGQDFLHQNPAEAREIYFRRTEANPEDPLMSAIFAATAPCFTFDQSMSTDYYLTLAGWMADRGLIEDVPDPSGMWTNQLAL